MSQKDIQILINQLKSDILEERIDAVKRLGELQNPSAIVPLVEALDYDGPYDEYAEIVDALLKFGKAATSALIEATESENTALHYYAVSLLGVIKDDASLEHLFKLLDKDSESTRGAIGHALGQFGELAIESLIERVTTHPNPNVRYSAMQGLSSITSPRVIDFAKKQLANESLRALAIYTIGNPRISDGLEERMQIILSYFDDPRQGVRFECVRAFSFGHFNQEIVVDTLIKHLNDPDITVKLNIIGALGRIGNIKAIDALVEEISFMSIGIMAIEALGEIGAKQAIPRILHTQHSVRHTTNVALKKLGYISEE